MFNLFGEKFASMDTCILACYGHQNVAYMNSLLSANLNQFIILGLAQMIGSVFLGTLNPSGPAGGVLVNLCD